MNAWYQVANEDQLPTPCLMLFSERIERNLHQLIAVAGGADRLRPHVKTHKLEPIVRLKQTLGIDKFKAATIAEAEMVAVAGGRDCLLAYPLVGPNIQRLMQLMLKYPGTSFSSLIDNENCIEPIEQIARQFNLRARLWLDLNVGMNRTGIAPGPEAAQLYHRIANSPWLEAIGLHAYDGHHHQSDPQQMRAEVASSFAPVWKLQATLAADGLPRPKLAGGGTPSLLALAEYPEVELGSGTSVLWDAGQASLGPPMDFQPAAVLLGRVVSRPGPELVTIDLGYKAVAAEMAGKRLVLLEDPEAKMVGQSEEHLVMRTEQPDLFPVGQTVHALPWHICPTVALHATVWVVKQGEAYEQWWVTARNRKLSV
jgi:D-serine deaminase-like pyridoxal phosphate-dependent protein